MKFIDDTYLKIWLFFSTRIYNWAYEGYRERLDPTILRQLEKEIKEAREELRLSSRGV